MRNVAQTSVLALAVGVLLAVTATATRAATVTDISTRTANWMVTSVPVGAPVPNYVDGSGFAGSTSLSTAGTAWSGLLNNNLYSYPALPITPNPGWTTALGGNWIGASQFGGTGGSPNGIYGLYEYTLTLPVAAGTYSVAGRYSSDNSVVLFTVNGVPVTVAPATNSIYDYNSTFAISGNGPTGPSIVIKAVVYNEANVYNAQGQPTPTGVNTTLTTTDGLVYPLLPALNGVTAWDSTANFHGFILDGAVTVVPLPAAAWMGISLLGALGVGTMVRSRLTRATA